MLRAAIVGLGAWGQRLVNSVQGSHCIQFVAGATRTVEASSGFARERGFPLYADYRKVLDDPDLDAVVLATPHSLHAQHVKRALDQRALRKARERGGCRRCDRNDAALHERCQRISQHSTFNSSFLAPACFRSQRVG